MLFSVRKDIPALKLIENELKYKIPNWYFHLIIIERFNEQLRTEMSKLKMTPNLMSGMVIALKKMIEIYDLDENQKKSVILIENLTEFLLLIAKSRSIKEINTENLGEILNFAIENTDNSNLFKILIAAQIFLENDIEIHGKISQFSLEKIINNMNTEDIDLSQASKDVITYILLNKTTRDLLNSDHRAQILLKLLSTSDQDKLIQSLIYYSSSLGLIFAQQPD